MAFFKPQVFYSNNDCFFVFGFQCIFSDTIVFDIVNLPISCTHQVDASVSAPFMSCTSPSTDQYAADPFLLGRPAAHFKQAQFLNKKKRQLNF